MSLESKQFIPPLRKWRTPPAADQYGVFPFDYISARNQYDGCMCVITVGGGGMYLCAPSSGGGCFASGVDPRINASSPITPPTQWKIVFRDDTYFNMFADGDSNRVANHLFSDDRLGVSQFDINNKASWFSLYIVNGTQVGMRAYEDDWPSNGLTVDWNQAGGYEICKSTSTAPPVSRPILKITKQTPYVQKFTSTDPKYTLSCCTNPASLDSLGQQVCKDRQLVGQGTLCDQFMMSYCTGDKLTSDPLCSCFQKSQELQSNPLLAPLAISPICVAPCTNSGYRTQGFIQANSGGCGHSCVQIQSVADQATATKFSQQMNCPGGAPPIHVDTTPSNPSGSGTETPGTSGGGSGSGGGSTGGGGSGSSSGGSSGGSTGGTSLTDLWNNNAHFRTGTYVVAGIIGIYVIYSVFFKDDDD